MMCARALLKCINIFHVRCNVFTGSQSTSLVCARARVHCIPRAGEQLNAIQQIQQTNEKENPIQSDLYRLNGLKQMSCNARCVCVCSTV